MSAWRLRSSLAKEIKRFIELRRLSGTDYASQTLLLGYFDRFLVEHHWGEPRLTREITDLYQQSLRPLAPRTQSNRFCVLRLFCKYLAGTDPNSYVPEPFKTIPSNRAHHPYIYSRAELQALLGAASDLAPPQSLRPHTFRTLLGLLYSTGIRIGEAFALNLQDLHATPQRLYIAQGKFRKARWLALSDSTCRALQHYVHRRLQKRPCAPDSPLLLNERGRRLCHPTVHSTFQRLLQRCGLNKGRDRPRIHDMRHTFAVDRLLAWYRDGKDVNGRLPALATYMGHVNISSTQVYLRPSAELLGEVHSRFHNHYLKHLNPQGASS